MEVWTPSPDDVGAILRSRTVDPNGRELGTFTAKTRPTDVQLPALIETAVADVRSETGTVPDSLMSLARRVAAIGAALQVELTYFPEESATGQGPYNQLETLYEKRLVRLVSAVKDYNADDPDEPSALEAMGTFDDSGLIGLKTRF